MISDTMENGQIWNTLQEPRCPTSLPYGSLLLLSALDSGWQISKVEIKPSWDQGKHIYLLTLRRPADRQEQWLILPRNATVDNLLQEMGFAFQGRRLAFHPAAR